MKDKNRKGFFGLFQHAKRNVENLEENEAPQSEPDDSSQSEESEVNDNNTTPTSNLPHDSEQADEPDEKEISSLVAIWEPSDDPQILRVNEELLEIERRQFAMKMKTLSNIYKKNAEAVVKTTEESKDDTTIETTDKPEPKAAQPQLFISRDCMAAWIYVIPPMNGGSDISEENLRSALAQDRIKTGILEETVKSIVKDHIYDQVLLIAKGVLAKNGIDGTIKDHFERVVQLEFEEDENGSVDYKTLNNIQSVKEGEVICEITPAIPGEDGMTVEGQKYPCTIKGIPIPVPSGRNTQPTEDGTLLISQKTGHVTFNNGKFQVDPLLKINGNIDNSTGNLDYDGDIFISGDVRNGFIVKATGGIDIRGSVEGAQLTAQGPITIASGMSGNGRGSLTSDSYIKCRYLEHCTVKAGGNVYAESIINSKVQSGDEIMVTSGIGVIIGGSLLAASNINANVIGSKVRRLITELTIANVPKNVEESTRLTRELEQLHHNLSEITKNITYLEAAQRPDKQHLLESLIQAADCLNIREQEINNRLNVIAPDDAEQIGLIKCRQLLPVVRVRIGSSSLLIQEECSSSVIYKNSEGEITIGTN
ncbi:FapA family protein [Clostridium boliviensis]|uniref:FapA family protein n=1 Tax=Clostridium boliviensis TaxID=318465 RepID=A0ABU4GKF0_9CLOT|nr:FapA family protein [Clostridium boliviensis]MDW2798095.1 FapA family protein [Clostridium boliviensis]